MKQSTDTRRRALAGLTAWAIAAFACFLLASPAFARSEGVEPAAPDRDEIAARLGELADNDPAAEAYRAALEALDRATALSDRASEFRAASEEAPARLEEARRRLGTPRSPVEIEAEPGAGLAVLRSSEAEAAAALQAAKNRVAELATEATRRDARRREIPGLLERARERRAALRAGLAMADSAGAAVDVADPDAVLAVARLAEASAEVAALEAELSSYVARRDLLPARRDLAARGVADAELLVAAWREVVRDAAAREAQRAADDAEALQRRAAAQDPAIEAYAALNAELAAQLSPDAAAPAGARIARDRLAVVSDRLDRILRNYRNIRARLRAADLNQATGRLLRRQFEQLEDVDDLRQSMGVTRRQLEAAEYALIERREARDELRSVERETARLMAGVAGDEAAPPEALASVARELVAARRDLLSELVNAASRRVDALLALQRAEARLLEASVAYRSFIRERILWVRSLPADRGPRLSDVRELSAWSSDPAAWAGMRDALGSWARERPGAVALPVLVLGAIITLALASPGRQRRIAERLRRPSTDSIWLTARGIGWAIALALPVPAVLYAVGWILRRPPEQTEVGPALGLAFVGAGVVWFGFALLRGLSRRGGVLEAHFRWPAAATARLRGNALWAGVVLAASMAAMALTDASGLEGAAATVGRFAFSAGAIATTVFALRVLHPRGPVVEAYVGGTPGERAHRLGLVFFWPLALLPLAFVVAAWLGYVYTAYQLSWLLALTFFLIVGVAIGSMFLRRWLFVVRRRLALEEARRRRAKAAERADAGKDAPAVTESGTAIEEDRLDLAGLSSQARQLIRVASVAAIVLGLAGIWGDFLPALRLLERVEVWPRVQVTDAEMTAEDEVLRSAVAVPSAGSVPAASPAPAAVPAVAPPAPALPVPGGLPTPADTAAAPDTDASGPAVVTLADVGLALLFLVVTVIAFRNLPGLAEIVLLQRLPLDAGSRYAIDTVLKYAIAIVGIFFALSAVGLSWNNIQWLAAALTFGLAFGLQEIFANFISGLIILAERPIRIGDTVTVQNVSGAVTKIKMRATTITDWERKELIIPNKAFITGDVVNWTLSDPVLRISVPVGVSYQTDVEEAERLLVSAARAEENVLSDPAPYVNFAAFGESTLDLELRAFVPHIDYLLSTRHALHKRVIRVFREAGIEIAFPQRDLHVKSFEGLGAAPLGREPVAPAASGASDAS